MSRFLFVALTFALLGVNPAAYADDWHGGHNNGPNVHVHGNPHGVPPGHAGYHHYAVPAGYVHGYYPYRPYPVRPYYYPVRPYAVPVGRPYYAYGYPYYQHKNNNNHSDWPAYLAGGLIIGALVTHAYDQSHPSTSYYSSASTSSYSSPPSTTSYSSPASTSYSGGSAQGRRLLRDINGNCYERQTDSAGNEMRTELPASECNW